MRKLFVLLPILLLLLQPVLAQSPEINRLLAEREQLMNQYRFYSEQKSNFWGKQSKKDLLQIIDVLKEIIRNDTKLITAYKSQKLRETGTRIIEKEVKSKQSEADVEQTQNLLYDLRSQVQSLESRVKARDRKVEELLQQKEDLAEDVRTNHQIILALSLGLMASLAFGITQRARANSRKRS